VIKILLILLAIVACKTGEGRKSEKTDPPVSVSDTYATAVDRLETDHLEDGWIVSRYQDGKPEHQGDALIWTGLALAALSCDRGAEIEDRMIRMLTDNGGSMVRYEPLGEYAGGREITFDGATGLYYGIFNRLKACGTHDKWRKAWALHLDALDKNNYVLHPNTTAIVPPQFNTIRDYISFMMGVEKEPGDIRYRALEAQAMTWASATVEAREPCFRVHLAFLYMSFVEDAGKMLESAHEGFCYATEHANLPIIDHWCARINIDDWIKEFEYNVWENRMQRCYADGWEQPDGRPGLDTPALDLIFTIAFAYPEILKK